VQPNDTLTSVSQKTGVPIATLQALNPTINVNSLQTGQSIRLRR
jgi:LysM repeat protein